MREDRVTELERAASMFDQGCGYKFVAAQLGVPKETVLKWAYTYRALGREALFVTEHRKYDHETKVRAARAVAEGEMTKPEAMEAFGLRSKTQIDTWCRLYREGGPDALLPKPKVARRRPSPPSPLAKRSLKLGCKSWSWSWKSKNESTP